MPARLWLRLPLLRILVFAMVLAVLPAKASGYETSFVETPVLVVTVAPSRVAETQAEAVEWRCVSCFVPAAIRDSRATRFDVQFVRLYRRFVLECSWLR